jgi:hypothetical protein
MGIKRINEFPTGSGSLSGDDIFLFMDSPSVSGVTKKITLSEFSNVIGVDRLIKDDKEVILTGNGELTLPASGSITFPNNTTQTSAGIPSNTGLVPNSISITNIVGISQANYDALVTKNSSTLYVIS